MAVFAATFPKNHEPLPAQCQDQLCTFPKTGRAGLLPTPVFYCFPARNAQALSSPVGNCRTVARTFGHKPVTEDRIRLHRPRLFRDLDYSGSHTQHRGTTRCRAISRLLPATASSCFLVPVYPRIPFPAECGTPLGWHSGSDYCTILPAGVVLFMSFPRR